MPLPHKPAFISASIWRSGVIQLFDPPRLAGVAALRLQVHRPVLHGEVAPRRENSVCLPILTGAPMDLAVLLPLAVMLALQAVIGLALLLPRAASAPVAKLLTAASGNAAAKSAVLTVAGAVGAMTVSSLIQLYGVMESLKKGSQYGDR